MLIAILILLPLAASPVLYWIGRRWDGALDACAAVVAGLELLLSVALLAVPSQLEAGGLLCGTLSFSSGGLRTAYSIVTSLLWLGTSVFSREYFSHERRGMGAYWAFIFITLGACQGVMLSGSFLTTYVFFEILSLSSFPWVIHERNEEAIRAACTYLAIAIIGGLILLMGVMLLYDAAGTLDYGPLPEAVAHADRGQVMAAAVCILLGFGAKAGMFPLHIWLPKAHPVAPAPASALLSGLLTKVGIFGVLMIALEVFSRDTRFGLLVMLLGTVTMVLGAVLALFSVNLKRTLACSSMSQIGFILVGIASMVLSGGYGTEEGRLLAWSGTMLHMVNHSMLKLVLFLSAGAVAMNLHALDLNDIRGWGRNKPILKAVFAVGALGISGVPLFNGYLSKTLLHEGLLHMAGHAGSLYGLFRGVEALFLISGGLTFAYMLKLFICVFCEENGDPERQAAYSRSSRCMRGASAAVLVIGALLLLMLGIPQVSTRIAGFMTGQALHHFSAFALENLKGSAISLLIGGLVYLLFVRRVLISRGVYRNLWPAGLDLEDAVYRPLLLKVLPGILGPMAKLFGENLILRPLCRFLVLAASVVGRAMDTGTDALILLSRRTVFREERVRDGRNLQRARRLRTFTQATGEALSQVLDNFSYAMMMTCVGIVLILGFLVIHLI